MANKTATKLTKAAKQTPLMKQYFAIKAKHPDAILLFRVGDFYETFSEDAIAASKALGIVLTARNNGGSKIELAGFPYHSKAVYLPRLVKAGFRVAICEQLERPSKEKKIVRRGVTEVVTPGVTTDEKLLDHNRNNYLASVFFGKREQAGVSFLDISTGEFLVCEGDYAYVDKLLQSFMPSEVIFSKDKAELFIRQFGDKFYTYTLDEWVFTEDYTREKLLERFEVQNLKGFGVEKMELAQIAAGATLHYLATTENKNLQHISSLSRILPENYVWLDRFTIRNLELLYSPHDGGVPLVDILDKTCSPMGARLLKKWVVLPLKAKERVEARHEIVGFFLKDEALRHEIELQIRIMGDLERLISRVPLGKISPREVKQLERALTAINPVKEKLLTTDLKSLHTIADGLNPLPALCQEIALQIVEEPPVNLNKGGVVANGFNPELDELRGIIKNAQGLLENIRNREAEATGIENLKIGFNNVFGYYLEVTNKHKGKEMPEDWVRKQTLTNAERYITDELKQLETKILGAEEKILAIETQIFDELILTLGEYIRPVQHNASLIAQLDCLISFAKISQRNNYVRPKMNDGFAIDIKNGRHPVIEQQLALGESYVPNDVYLDKDEQQVLMITGPNMSGKSALLRQTALISLMAQMGCFVPAASADLGMIDKVFTRVGASDNISSGESTFMVEMNETASIMNNISDRSLILLDEIGRGTSTYDGISIAWSIAEFLHNNGQVQPKTLFATHYHELNELAGRFPRVRNFHVSTKEVGQKVIFLRKLTAGGSEHSFGIHVAKMAGMPRAIVERASHILAQLEEQRVSSNDREVTTPDGIKTANPDTGDIMASMQLSIFETSDPVIGKIKEQLLDLNVNSMTPIECMMKLNELRGLLDES
ncbi:MAG: DNA mismatch repair protein MutS [Saprospiraceae bacterium]|jgi:DNA mismatch repair protein MutS